jgi:glycosyltransferase involved in cell wall biosynthesis
VPLFSILIATRDRPLLFGEALASVLAQEERDIELVVVDDGSADAHRAAYRDALAPAAGRLRLHRLPRRARGHGPSYALNAAAADARGDYLAILDDDDVWTDPGHLARARRTLAATGADLYMANQKGYRAGAPVAEELWLAGLDRALRGRPADAEGGWAVGVDDLVRAAGFCHLNCLIVRRALWEEVGGMDDAIRWEGDRDLFLRLIDRAGPMVHNPAFVARHNIPDPALAANVTTATPALAKRLDQLRVVDKAALLARHPTIRAVGRRHRAWVLERLAAEAAAGGDRRAAAHFARAAFAARPSPASLAAAARHALRVLRGR